MKFSKIEDAIQSIKNGDIIIVCDDENRENEGDFILSADFVDDKKINFLISQGKGLVCAPIEQDLADKLELYPMIINNTDRRQTAFTISIDHINCSTGISASERALTIKHLCNPNVQPSDFIRPGHIFPLIAVKGGVLERNGHTEASIDLMKLAGLKPVAIICEILMPDGSMARRDDLFKMAAQFNMPFITIKDLIEYIKLNGLKNI